MVRDPLAEVLGTQRVPIVVEPRLIGRAADEAWLADYNARAEAWRVSWMNHRDELYANPLPPPCYQPEDPGDPLPGDERNYYLPTSWKAWADYGLRGQFSLLRADDTELEIGPPPRPELARYDAKGAYIGYEQPKMGRPSKINKLSRAEIQKAYRARKKEEL